jgi:hypothetical protein
MPANRLADQRRPKAVRYIGVLNGIIIHVH